MPASASLVATLTEEPSEALLEGLGGRASVIEVRADLAGDLDPDRLRRGFDGELLYTLRSESEGGRGPDGREERARRLGEAARRYDLVDLEGRDLDGAVERVLSWHGRTADTTELRAAYERLAAVEARYLKLVPLAAAPGDGLASLQLLRDLARPDLIAFAAGAAGAWTRLIAPRLGAPLIYAAAGETEAAPGQPRLDRLCEDYGLPELPEVEELFGIAGLPALHSLSPRLHNGLYRRLGLPALYVAFEVESFGDFWLELVEAGTLGGLGLELRGLTVTSPHKEIALAVAAAASPLAERLGSANTLVRHEDAWEAESTDPDGVIGPLQARGLAIAGRRVAVIGAGGAGRAAAFALERGVRAARRVGVAFVALRSSIRAASTWGSTPPRWGEATTAGCRSIPAGWRRARSCSTWSTGGTRRRRW